MVGVLKMSKEKLRKMEEALEKIDITQNKLQKLLDEMPDKSKPITPKMTELLLKLSKQTKELCGIE